jgi:diguanylate cyclase (GGDEF)-like protein/PAS domain S-box-containing protein
MGKDEILTASLLNSLDSIVESSSAQQHFFARIVENTSAAIAISDIRQHDQPLVYVNEAFEHLTGFTAAEILGRNCRFLQGPLRDQSEIAILSDAITDGRSIRTLIRNYRKSGEVFWNDLTLAPMRDGAGSVTHYFSICFDVSATIAQKQEAEKLSANWKALIDISMGLTLIVDKSGVISFVNDAVARAVGITPASAIGRSWLEVLNAEDPVKVAASLAELQRPEIEFVSFDLVYRNANGERAWLGCKARDALTHPHIKGIVIAAQDITSDRMMEQLAYAATHDALTHIHNRHHLSEWYEKYKQREPDPHMHLVMWLADLDQFKALNDSCGHVAGDEFLCRYAEALNAALSPRWQVARLGGDEFAVVGESSSLANDVEAVSKKILSISQAAYPVANTTISLSASIGVAVTKAPLLSFSDLMRNADIAMYDAKRRGRNAYESFDIERSGDALARNGRLRDVATALARNEFCIAFQPIVDGLNRIVVKYEALLRWRHPSLGMLSASHFIDELSLTGMCENVTLWVLDESLRFHDAALRAGDVRLSLNVWARSFRHRDFAMELIDIIRKRALDPSCLEVELVETDFVMACSATTQNLALLGRNGVRIVVDDFGKGFSNLSYLQKLNVQGIKVDGSFVWNIGVEEKSEKLIRAVLGLAEDLGLDVVAEGIETEQQRQFLLNEGCQMHQGFFYGRPTIVTAMA